MTLKLVTFDLDDTLWDIAPVMRNAETVLQNWLIDHATHLGPFPSEALRQARKRLLEQEPGLKHRLSELRRRVLFHALLEADYPQATAREMAEAGFQVFLQARHQVSLFPEVRSTLAQLAEHFTLAVLTNGNADIRQLGLADYFQFTLCAEELGVGKPDPLPFLEAVRRAGVEPHQALHIGDHLIDDVEGALRAGLQAVWFNPHGLKRETNGNRYAEIRKLSELPDLLRPF